MVVKIDLEFTPYYINTTYITVCYIRQGKLVVHLSTTGEIVLPLPEAQPLLDALEL